jgi:RNA polymerase sigma-70 factor (ECF subfamily)
MALAEQMRQRGHVLSPEDGARLDATLLAHWQAARERWPRVRLSLERYAQHVATVLPSGAGDALDDIAGEDLFLAAAIVDGDRAAHEIFEAEFLAVIGRHVARVDASAAFADELKQALRQRLLVGDNAPPRIAVYSGQGSLAGWVRVTAVRLALNLRRSEVKTRPLDDVLQVAAGGHTPELQLIVARSRAAVEEALRATFTQLAREDRALLRLHLVDNLSIDALAKLYQIHRSTAARRIATSRQTFVEQTLKRLSETLKLSPRELESMLGLVRSRIELSLNDLLATVS